MKKHLAIILSLLLVLMGMSACADNTGQNNHNNSNNNGGGTTPPAVTAKNVLIAYFSCTGTTAGIAERIAEETGGTLHEIQPAVPYTEEDLDYYSGGRADQEQADPAARPAIANSVENMQDYDIVFLGYPIWHGQAPKIIYTFLESYDFSGKTIIPFCTSGSSGIGSSDDNLHPLAANADWKEGTRFSSGTTKEEIKTYLDSLGIKTGEESVKMKITVKTSILEATLADNSSVEALIATLKKASLTIEMRDYANFEKVGPLGFNLPRNDEPITAEAGDLILYQGNQFVIYYGTNTWNFTRLGKIENVTGKQSQEILGSDNVTVTLSI